MKKSLFILLIMIVNFESVSCQTGVYHPFPDSNAIWVGNSWHNAFGENCRIYDEYNLYISGDTTIGLYSYHELYKNGYI
jgi:hypothetical protein